MEENIDGYTGNGLTLEGPPFGLEKIYDYESGGHHPIHLGDRLGKDGRYRVIHKLGNGGSANIWLCRDLECETPKYVGLKILMAEASTDGCRELHILKLKEMRLDREVGGQYNCLPLDHFQIDGPNGSHICFVYPVLGPRVSCILKESENPEKALRKIAFQTVQGMVTLHSHGICHGGC
jgi:serine/threonine protein kinase